MSATSPNFSLCFFIQKYAIMPAIMPLRKKEVKDKTKKKAKNTETQYLSLFD